MSAHSSRTTTDHDEIRQWAEARKATPAKVKGTGSGDDPGMIRLDFPGFSGADSLEHISWDDWFRAFDDNGLALVYQDTTADGAKSNFNKLIARETASAREQGDSHASRHHGGSQAGTSRSSGEATHRASGSSDLDSREYRDDQGEIHHHTHSYMEEHRGERSKE